MQEIQIQAVAPKEKGRVAVRFENGTELLLYRGEVRRYLLREGEFVPWETYEKLLYGVVGLRAKKRAMHLLERMDRTEKQLYDKLKQNGYPEVCIEQALLYVKDYHYVDDLRYAKNYIRLYQQKKSRQKLKYDLMAKGADKRVIEQALAEEFDSDEQAKIRSLLEKRCYAYGEADPKEWQRTYQFLMRRGFLSSDILHVMKTEEPF